MGLFGDNGWWILEFWYEDIKVLDFILIVVMSDKLWMVVNFFGKVILEKGYEWVYVVCFNFFIF